MSAGHGFSLRGWAALSGTLLLVACQAQVVETSPAVIGPRGPTQQATVTDIVDGDTIHVEIGGQEYRVRYIGIDAPEVAHDNNPGERLGLEATLANAALVDGQLVILERDVSDTDQFGRLLRYVWTGGPGTWQFVNEELAAQGLVDVKRYPPDTARQAELQAAEDTAREADVGIWGTSDASN